jgi:hypothetical protein
VQKKKVDLPRQTWQMMGVARKKTGEEPLRGDVSVFGRRFE